MHPAADDEHDSPSFPRPTNNNSTLTAADNSYLQALDRYVATNLCAIVRLHAAEGGEGVVYVHEGPGQQRSLSLQPTSGRRNVSCVGRVLVSSSRGGTPAPPPGFRFPRLYSIQARALKVWRQGQWHRVFPGLMCPRLRREVTDVVLRHARSLQQQTARSQREMAGLIMQRPNGTVRLVRHRGSSKHLSVEPTCRVQAPCILRDTGPATRSSGGEEWPQTAAASRRGLCGGVPHPPIGRGVHLIRHQSRWTCRAAVEAVDIAPPSAADLYQLALAAGKREHNCSFVVAMEGLYVCNIEPELAHRTVEGVERFLALNGYSRGRIQRSLGHCEQPLTSLVKRYRNAVPDLWRLVRQPMEVYRGLCKGTPESRHWRIQQFCQAMRADLGIRIHFIPSDRFP